MHTHALLRRTSIMAIVLSITLLSSFAREILVKVALWPGCCQMCL